MNRLNRLPGILVIAALGVLTIIEYIVSAADVPGGFTWLTIVAVTKAALIIAGFMHLGNVLRPASS